MLFTKGAIRKKLILKAISQGWGRGEQDYLSKETFPTTLEQFIFDSGFGRALWGEEMIILRDIKTTRGQTLSEPAWRFHAHIILDFLQIAREDLAYEYLKQFLE